jgi:hypothetical protein
MRGGKREGAGRKPGVPSQALFDTFSLGLNASCRKRTATRREIVLQNAMMFPPCLSPQPFRSSLAA